MNTKNFSLNRKLKSKKMSTVPTYFQFLQIALAVRAAKRLGAYRSLERRCSVCLVRWGPSMGWDPYYRRLLQNEFTQAAKTGHARVLQLLLPLVVDTDYPVHVRPNALQTAALHGHTDAVVFLLGTPKKPLSHELFDEYGAVVCAARKHHEEALGALMQRLRAQAVLEKLGELEDWWMLEALAPYVPEEMLRETCKAAPSAEAERALARLESAAAAPVPPAPSRSFRRPL